MFDVWEAGSHAVTSSRRRLVRVVSANSLNARSRTVPFGHAQPSSVKATRASGVSETAASRSPAMVVLAHSCGAGGRFEQLKSRTQANEESCSGSP